MWISSWLEEAFWTQTMFYLCLCNRNGIWNILNWYIFYSLIITFPVALMITAKTFFSEMRRHNAQAEPRERRACRKVWSPSTLGWRLDQRGGRGQRTVGSSLFSLSGPSRGWSRELRREKWKWEEKSNRAKSIYFLCTFEMLHSYQHYAAPSTSKKPHKGEVTGVQKGSLEVHWFLCDWRDPMRPGAETQRTTGKSWGDVARLPSSTAG